MREKKIDVLVVQETYFGEELQMELNNFFERQILIMSSIDSAQSGVKGVAIILRKQSTK